MKIYVGYDSSQRVAFDACINSIRYHSNIEIVPVIKNDLEQKNIYVETKQGSTEFSFTRFLVPYLNNYEGVAIFCDSDFVWNCDPLELGQYVNNEKAVYVVKHIIDPDKVPSVKMNDKKQFWYPKKNWSSLMIFNCFHKSCINLTPSLVSECSGQYLHEFQWVEDNLIGEIPKTYNYLVGYYDDIDYPKAIHFTSGGPWHVGYENVPFSETWKRYSNV